MANRNSIAGKNMMYILLSLSVILAVLKSSIYNNYAKNENLDAYGVFRFNVVSYAISALAALMFDIGDSLSFSTLYSAIFYAVVVCSLQAMSIVAMSEGPMSATTLMVLYGMIIPAIAGPLFWNEEFTAIQAVGVITILISMWLLNDKGASNNKLSKKWGFYAVLCFFLSGFAGLAEKIHQSSDGRNERTMFLFIAYIIMLMISAVGVIVTKNNRKNSGSLKSIAINGGFSGIIIWFYAFINLTLAGNLDTMIYYPVANGGPIILTVLISVAFFREKCTRRQIVGFIIGFLSVILLSFGG